VGTDPFLQDGGNVWWTTTCGWVCQDQSGVTTVLAPPVQYPNTPWSTQAMAIGGPNNGYGGGAANTAVIGDSLVGQAINLAEMAVATGPTDDSSTRVTVVVIARVVATNTGTDSVGDRCTISQDWDFDLVAGTMTVTPVGSPTVTSFVQIGGGTIGSFVFNLTALGAGIQVEYNTLSCSTFDAGVQVDIGIFSHRSVTI
jgi:hypothetical protein